MELDTRKGSRFASTDLVLRAAAQGLGVALARGRLAADDVTTGTLVRTFGDHEIRIANAYWVLTPQNRVMRTATSRVIDWLKTQI